ncbi:hypothetical protein PAHAL_2G179700 [Panicum hallii]|uniref:Uncharacterized protein n=1 Tax=Panicum hallii TaxID=206008 RepID=A0A2S3GYH3_9POAL|nr:hypothetical protein PAHAL_2G179700 [Panicum hallii]
MCMTCSFFLQHVMIIKCSNCCTIVISRWSLVTNPKFDQLQYSILQTWPVLKS